MSTYRPINLAGLHWLEGRRVASFGSSRPGYGVEVVATGEVLASDGVCPSVWRTRAVAAEIALSAEWLPSLRPVQVFGSVAAAALALRAELDPGSADAFRNFPGTV